MDMIIKEFRAQLSMVKLKRTQEVAVTVRSRGSVESDILVTAPDIEQHEDGTTVIIGRGVCFKIPPVEMADRIIRVPGEVYPVYQLQYGNIEVEYIFLTAIQGT